MSRIGKRDGSSVYQRLKADLKERRTERHREFMDRKLGRHREDGVSSSPAPDPSAQMWAEAAQMLGMKAESDGQGGVHFSDPSSGQSMDLKADSDGILRWQFPEAPEAPPSNGEVQLVKDQDGVLRWVLPDEPAPQGSQAPVGDLWKQVGEQLGMAVEDNGQGGLIFRDR